MRPVEAPANRWRTLEILLWLALGIVSAWLRLTDLSAAPLTSQEAAQAVPAYEAARAVGSAANASVPSPSESPLLFHLNVLLFALFDGGDGLARLVPALAGVALTVAPLLLRRYLGAWGALGTGLLLALSPTALVASRTLDGAVPAALGVMLLVGSAARYLDSFGRSWVVWGGLGMALAVTAGPGAWGFLLGLLLALAGGLWLWRAQLPWIWPMVRPALGRALAVAGLGVVAIGTAFGLHPAGLTDVAQQVILWAERFAPGTEPVASPVLLLAAYEPLVVLAGLAGLGLAARRRHGMGLLWAFWTVVGALQLALMPGRQPVDLLWIVLPLAGLGGLAVDQLAQSLLTHGHWLNEGLYLPVSLVLWARCGLSLARYARTGDVTDLAIAVLVVLLQLFLTGALGFALAVPAPDESPNEATRRGMGVALRAGGLSLGVVLLMVTFATGWGVAHARPSDPRELLHSRPIAEEVRVLVQVAEQASVLNSGTEAGLSVTFLGETDPALAWALRRFERHAVSGLEMAGQPPLVVAPADQPPAPGYFGEVFPLRREWTPTGGGFWTARWWLYRESAAPPVATDWVALWLREDLATHRQAFDNE